MFCLYLEKIGNSEMRILVITLIGLFLGACTGNEKTDKTKIIENLTHGEWRIKDSEEPFLRFDSGLKFSSDKQVFFLDSQGHVIPPHHEHIFTVHGDTLKIVDYKYEPHLIFEEGTDVLLIKELTKEKLVLEALHPKKNVITLYKIH